MIPNNNFNEFIYKKVEEIEKVEEIAIQIKPLF